MITRQVNDFLEHLDPTNQHIVSIAEDPADSLAIQIKFAKSALELKQHVVFAIHSSEEAENIRNELLLVSQSLSPQLSLGKPRPLQNDKLDNDDDNNNVAALESSASSLSVHFVIIQNPLENADGLKVAFAKAKEMIFSSIPPSTKYNIIIRMVPELNSDRQIDAQVMIEKMWDAFFYSDSINERMLCPYAIKSIEDSHKNDGWLVSLLKLHNSVIFLPKDGASLALNLPKTLK